MTEPDVPLITRRRMLYLAGIGTSAAVLGACSSSTPATLSGSASDDASGTTASPTSTPATTTHSPDCVLTASDAAGPFYADDRLDRSDITDGRPGSPLRLDLTVVDAATCQPVPGAVVDIWHADAIGQYSAFPGQGDGRDVDTSDERFLRGVQSVDAAGLATFTSIYPGWYPGRTTHIHLKVHLADRTEVTTQLYFPDEITAAVYERDHYTERGQKDTANSADGLGADEGSLMMTVRADPTANDGAAPAGHVATHTIGIRTS